MKACSCEKMHKKSCSSRVGGSLAATAAGGPKHQWGKWSTKDGSIGCKGGSSAGSKGGNVTVAGAVAAGSE